MLESPSFNFQITILGVNYFGSDLVWWIHLIYIKGLDFVWFGWGRGSGASLHNWSFIYARNPFILLQNKCIHSFCWFKLVVLYPRPCIICIMYHRAGTKYTEVLFSIWYVSEKVIFKARNSWCIGGWISSTKKILWLLIFVHEKSLKPVFSVHNNPFEFLWAGREFTMDIV